MRPIDADAALKALRKCQTYLYDARDPELKIELSSAEAAINNLPTIQPEQQEGHWIDKGWNGDWAWQIDGRGNCWRVIECSECGKSVLVESNFCPNCGARMKGVKHETD